MSADFGPSATWATAKKRQKLRLSFPDKLVRKQKLALFSSFFHVILFRFGIGGGEEKKKGNNSFHMNHYPVKELKWEGGGEGEGDGVGRKEK